MIVFVIYSFWSELNIILTKTSSKIQGNIKIIVLILPRHKFSVCEICP